MAFQFLAQPLISISLIIEEPSCRQPGTLTLLKGTQGLRTTASCLLLALSPSPHHSIPSFKGVCLCEDSGKTRNGSNQSWASGKLGYIYRKSWPQSLHPRLIEPRVIFSKENEILRKSFKIICWKRREKINWGEQPCLIHPYISYSLNFFLKAFHLGLPSV